MLEEEIVWFGVGGLIVSSSARRVFLRLCRAKVGSGC
jgi:hypothetical protein